MIDFEIEKYNKNTPIVIWGCKGVGRLLYYGLKKKRIEVFAFADSYEKGEVFGVPILSPKQLAELYQQREIIVLIGVYLFREEIIKKMDELNITRYYDAWNILSSAHFEKQELPEDEWYLYKIRKYYLYYKLKQVHPEQFFLDRMDVVVTERCSLRCRDCANLMQYYTSPNNFKCEDLRNSIDRVLSYTDCLGDFRIIGGEPFMHPDFSKLIQWYEANKKIYTISIWSNATIYPSQEVRDKLINDKVIMRFSDYGELSSALGRWIDFCEKEKIAYIVSRSDKWQDLGGLYKRGYSKEALRQVYSECECRNFPTLLNGKLYNCPYAANAANLHAMLPEEIVQDSLDFSSDHRHYTSSQIRDFLEKKDYLMACDYCSGRNFKDGGIEPNIQTAQPLNYTRHFE